VDQIADYLAERRGGHLPPVAALTEVYHPAVVMLGEYGSDTLAQSVAAAIDKQVYRSVSKFLRQACEVRAGDAHHAAQQVAAAREQALLVEEATQQLVSTDEEWIAS
jgi:hypothetical protein